MELESKNEIHDQSLKEIYESVSKEINSKVEDYFKGMNTQQSEYLDHIHEELLSLESQMEELEKYQTTAFKPLEELTEDERLEIKSKSAYIKRCIENISNKIIDVEKIPESIVSRNISEILNIKDGKFEKLVFSTTIGKVISDEVPAHICLSNHCKQCKKQLSWGGYGTSGSYGNTCNFSDNCNYKSKYCCNDCQLKFCTNCAYPPDPNYCGCGQLMSNIVLNFNNCDLCAQSIPHGTLAWRCTTCDFDICPTCYERIGGVK